MSIGRQCQKLLENRSLLTSLLLEHNSSSYCEPIVKCFDSLHAVVRSCLGMVQYPRYPNDIKDFAASFFALKEHAEQINFLKKPIPKIHVSVTLKNHDIFIHVKQYLEMQKQKNNVEFGLGFYSEQRYESSKISCFQILILFNLK